MTGVLCVILRNTMLLSAYAAAESRHGPIVCISANRETSTAVAADGSLWIRGEVSGGGMPYSIFTPTIIMDNVKEVVAISSFMKS